MLFYSRLLVFFLFFFVVQRVDCERFRLSVTVTNIKSKKGKLQLGLYRNGEDYIFQNKQFKSFSFAVTDHTHKITILELPPDEYALLLFQDENEDGVCNTNLFGYPLEGYAFSENTKPWFLIPSFEDCKFNLNKSLELTIPLNY